MTDEMLSASVAVDPMTLVHPDLMPMMPLIQQMMAAAPPPSIELMIKGQGCAERPAARAGRHARSASSASFQDRPGRPTSGSMSSTVRPAPQGPASSTCTAAAMVSVGAAHDYVGHIQPMAAALDCVIVTVDYRLAPETGYPGSLEDNYTALRWAHDNADEIGLDRDRIALLGESAGGGHAAALAILARDRGEIPLVAQVLLYPMLDDRTGVTAPVPPHIGTFIWTPASNRLGWTALLGRAPGGPDTPMGAAPARVEDLTGLPPTFIGVGALDLFVNEDIEYARRLLDAGVSTELVVVPGAFHAFDLVSPQAAVCRTFTAAKLEALRRAFGSSA